MIEKTTTVTTKIKLKLSRKEVESILRNWVSDVHPELVGGKIEHDLCGEGLYDPTYEGCTITATTETVSDD